MCDGYATFVEGYLYGNDFNIGKSLVFASSKGWLVE